MRSAFISIILCTLFTGCSAQKAEVRTVADAEKKAAKPVVLVELFTSEGCSSCPPADRALTYLMKQELTDVEIVTLALHVDYWDNYGWRDRFSSHAFTERQQEYARRMKTDSTYTPQMVVDGQTEFIGSDLRKATAAIGEAVRTPKGHIEAVLAKDVLNIGITDLLVHQKATVYLAIVEDGIFTEVKGGENAGSRLEHSSVGRKLIEIGTIEGGVTQADLTSNIKLETELKPENLNYVVFVQEDKSRKIIAVGKALK